MPGREPNMEDAPYRIFRAPKPSKKKKKETYEQLELPLALRKKKFKHDPRTSANA
tara:strand:+ start:480 stop:644 length:165 start_codon:yes stop_codon:yes gene_type:complete